MPPPTEPVRLVQVGAGAMGRAWLRLIGRSTDVRLVGLADLDVDTARRSAADTGFTDVTVATTLEELLDRVDADAVVNVTIPEAHAEVSTIALLGGLAVLCEKPLADTLPAALSMIAAAEAGGRLLMVSQSRRYWRNVEALRGQIARLGQLGLVTCSVFRGPHFGGFREQMAYPLLRDMAIHQFDLARDLIGSEPVSISCESFNPDWSWFAGDAAAEVNAEFADGTRFLFTGVTAVNGIVKSATPSAFVSQITASALDTDLPGRCSGTPVSALKPWHTVVVSLGINAHPMKFNCTLHTALMIPDVGVAIWAPAELRWLPAAAVPTAGCPGATATVPTGVTVRHCGLTGHTSP